MGIAMASGSSLGSDIQTTEIDDAAITPAKLGTGWILQTSGTFSGTSAPFDLTSLPEKKRWMLVVNIKADASTAEVRIRLNNDSGNNYGHLVNTGTTLTQYLSQSLIRTAYVYGTSTSIISSEFVGDGTGTVGFTGFSSTYSGSQVENYLGGYYAGSAVLSRITLTTTTNCTGRYALYYNKDIEDAT